MKKRENLSPVSDDTFPLSPEAITPDWLNRVMERTGNRGGIESIEFVPVGSGFGLLSENRILKLHYSSAVSAGTKSLFAKSSHQDESIRRIIHKIGYYKREIFFYRELANRSSVPTPECYYASIDSATGHNLIILEAPEYVRPGDDLIMISSAHLESVFTKIAAFHAQWWQDAGRMLRLIMWTCCRQ